MRLEKTAAIILSLICSTTHSLMAQQKKTDYAAVWKRVDSLAGKKGLTRSALNEAGKIYNLAKKEGQEAQAIRALLYQVSLEEKIDEDAALNGIERLETEMKTTTGSSKAVLSSLVAGRYQAWFQQHRWQLYNRTATAGFNKKDIATWGIDDFNREVSSLYLASIKEKKSLQQTALDVYAPVILKGNMRYLRPTLYDLLAHRALAWFENDERSITKPADGFEIADAAAFSPAAAFCRQQLHARDSGAFQYRALAIYQGLLAFHEKDARPDALIDADLGRLQFVYRKAVMEDKEQLYEEALRRLAGKYDSLPAAAQVWYLLAQAFAGKASRYDALKDSSGRFDYLPAKAICDKVLLQKDSSEGSANCYNLLRQIERKEIRLSTENINVPDQPFRTLVQYRNITRLYCRVVPVDEQLKNKLANRYDDKYWQDLVALPPTRNWVQQLPATDDYQQHGVEIKIDALPAGSYFLLCSANAGFSAGNNPLSVQFFQVSNISYINNGRAYFVLHRQTGQPLPNASIQVWQNEYDYNARRYNLRKGTLLHSDESGHFILPAAKKGTESDTRLEISYKEDHLFTDNAFFTYYRNETGEEKQYRNAEAYEAENDKLFLFTDRAIYRPGQTVYFKGIGITRDFETRKLRVTRDRDSVEVTLQDVNGDTVDSMVVHFNQFGAFSGKFILPGNRLNGEFHIETDWDATTSAAFSVEDYKRPKFYVSYDTLKGSHRLNDSIKVNGLARAFAGNTINGATVKYRVQRVARFIYPWLYREWGLPRGNNAEIGSGITSTGADGSFSVTFKAIPDATVSPALKPVFDYRISADVTDINGETRSAQVTIPVAYTALQLSIDLSDGATLPADSLKKLAVSVRNTAGSPDSVPVRVTVSRLEAPNRLIRNRYWSRPDQFVMTREAFLADFPHDEYAAEADYHNWKTETVLFQGPLNSQSPIPYTAALNSGWYKIEATAGDRYGTEVKDVKLVLVYNEKSNAPTLPVYAWSALQPNKVEPGETATVNLGTGAANAFIIEQVDRPGTGNLQPATANYRLFRLSDESKSIPFTATESDRGGFGVAYCFVLDNRFYNFDYQIMVPWTSKELNIAWETFRDKTLPGSAEQWKLKISGYTNEKVAAELLAGMYDASLDQFRPNNWQIPGIWQRYAPSISWSGINSFRPVKAQERYYGDTSRYFNKVYDRIAENDYDYSGSQPNLHLNNAVVAAPVGRMEALQGNAAGISVADDRALNDVVVVGYSAKKKNEGADMATNARVIMPAVRKNFNETAFFFPDLKTEADGSISFGFTLPDALTTWKLQVLAHTADLALGYASKTVITQKPLMIQPNAPRFLREGDQLALSAKVVNMEDREISGTVQLELINAATGKPVDGWFRNMYPVQYFTVAGGQSAAVNFPLNIPYGYNSALTYRFIAKAGASSDGEEADIPVLSNSMLVTESLPLPVRGNGTKKFHFGKLLHSDSSETLQPYKLTVEFTANPAWYAIQALPFLAEYPYECAEQTFNRYYANALAATIAAKTPKLKAVFDQWRNRDTAALQSNLQKNEDLKGILLEETPWVLQAKTEAGQKRNIALLFDMDRMAGALQSSLEKLKQLQSPNGGFSWFKGGPDDRYITQYILSGIGHLNRLGALPPQQQKEWEAIIASSMAYLDQRIKEDYDNLAKHKASPEKNNLGHEQVQYLYMRSLFSSYGIPGASFAAVNYYRKQSRQYWLQQNKFMQGMIALALYRSSDRQTAEEILRSLRQNAIVNEETGMYWKDNTGGYYWQQAPVETQSLLIEAFAEIHPDAGTVEELKTWLLKQKQTGDWKTTRATADACYALLLQGGNWLNNTPQINLQLGDKIINGAEEKQETGTGYFKQSVDGPFIKPSMGNISVTVSGNNGSATPAWGAVYWQYFEQLDKITPAATPLQLEKKLFVEKNTARGPQLNPVNNGDYLKTGDKVVVRLVLRADRDMEYVQLKDLRAGCMEPVNVLSGYKWQDGLGYYESTRDASTNFFFGWLPKGTYVFEYPMFVTHTGNFSNGIATIGCMYAPEFSAHSEGIRVNVE